MKNSLTYTPQGVCSRGMDVETEDGLITQVVITGGCAGNAQGMANLLRGMTVEEAIKRLEGIDCKGRGTSCPDQLSKALKNL